MRKSAGVVSHVIDRIFKLKWNWVGNVVRQDQSRGTKKLLAGPDKLKRRQTTKKVAG